MCVLGGGGAEEPGESSAEQEQRTGAAEQRQEQRPRPADPPGNTHTLVQPTMSVFKLNKCTI